MRRGLILAVAVFVLLAVGASTYTVNRLSCERNQNVRRVFIAIAEQELATAKRNRARALTERPPLAQIDESSVVSHLHTATEVTVPYINCNSLFPGAG